VPFSAATAVDPGQAWEAKTVGVNGIHTRPRRAAAVEVGVRIRCAKIGANQARRQPQASPSPNELSAYPTLDRGSDRLAGDAHRGPRRAAGRGHHQTPGSGFTLARTWEGTGSRSARSSAAAWRRATARSAGRLAAAERRGRGREPQPPSPRQVRCRARLAGGADEASTPAASYPSG